MLEAYGLCIVTTSVRYTCDSQVFNTQLPVSISGNRMQTLRLTYDYLYILTSQRFVVSSFILQKPNVCLTD